MNIANYVIGTIGLMAIAWLIYSFNTLQKIIKIRRSPTFWIGSLPDQGRVEVNGKVETNHLVSPITDTECAFWKVSVQEMWTTKTGTPEQKVHWKPVYENNSGQEITIDDGTGKVQVKARNAVLEMEVDNFISNIDSPTLQKLSKLGVSPEDEFGKARELVVYETLILPGDEVFVSGMVEVINQNKIISEYGGSLIITDKSEGGLLANLYRDLLSRAGKVVMFTVTSIAALVYEFVFKKK